MAIEDIGGDTVSAFYIYLNGRYETKTCACLLHQQKMPFSRTQRHNAENHFNNFAIYSLELVKTLLAFLGDFYHS